MRFMGRVVAVSLLCVVVPARAALADEPEAESQPAMPVAALNVAYDGRWQSYPADRGWTGGRRWSRAAPRYSGRYRSWQTPPWTARPYYDRTARAPAYAWSYPQARRADPDRRPYYARPYHPRPDYLRQDYPDRRGYWGAHAPRPYWRLVY